MLAVAAAVVYSAAVLARPEYAVLSLLSDDAFYYFEIARNVLSGHGFTFDGIAPTNGFHPLWMVVVLGVSRITGSHEFAPLVLVLLLGGAMTAAALLWIHQTVEHYIARGAGWVAVSAALLPNTLTAMLNGLETGIQLLLSVVLVGACYRHGLLAPGASPRRLCGLGLLIGAVIIARLDSVFLIAAALLMVGVAGRGLPAGVRILRLFFLGAGTAVVVGPYLGWNLVRFGHLTPSSAVAKSSFPALVEGMSFSDDKPWGALMLAALWGMIAFTRLLERRRKSADELVMEARVPFWSSPVSLLAIACTLHFLHAFLFLAWGVYWWHFALYGLGIVFALPAALTAAAGRRARLRRLAVVGVSVCLVAFSGWRKYRELPVKAAQHAGWLEAARWARDHTEERDVFAILDAGIFGYFSHRPVVNLDGKANSYEFLRHVDSGTVDEYLRSVGIRYVADIRVHYRKNKQRIFIPRVNKDRVPLVMDEAWEVYRGEPIPSRLPRFGTTPTSRFVIWKLPEAPAS